MNRCFYLFLFLIAAGLLLLLGPPLWSGEGDYFWSLDNGRFLATQSAWLTLGALGMMLIITTGGLDLSAAAIVALGGSMSAAWLAGGGSPGMALLIGLATGAGAGALNGAVISLTRFSSILVTLAMAGIYAGWATMKAPRAPLPASWLGDLLAPFPTPFWLLLPPAFWGTLLIGGLLAFAMRFTVIGVHLLAIGSNEAASRLCGVPVGQRRTLAYTFAGLLFGAMGVLQAGQLGAAPPVSPSLLPTLITAAIIGKLATRGSARVGLTALAACGITLLHNASQQAGYPPWSQAAITAILLLLALYGLKTQDQQALSKSN